MAIRTIRVVPDPVLRTPCDPVKTITPAVRSLVQDLVDTVDDPGRAGLSANQIGVGLRVFSYNIGGKVGYIINPVIDETRGSSTVRKVASPFRISGIRPEGPNMPRRTESTWMGRPSPWRVAESWAG